MPEASSCDSSANCTLDALLPRLLASQSLKAAIIRVEDARLSGTLPANLHTHFAARRKEKLRGLTVSSTRISGTIPSQLGLLSRAWTIALDSPRISGTMPDFVSTSVRHLSMQLPRLSGTLPELGTLPRSLESLEVRGTRVSGTLPTAIGGACAWRSSGPPVCPPASTEQNLVDLRGNRISGTLPEQLRWGSGLGDLRLGSNSLSGTLPTSLAHFHRVSLDANSLSGSLPSALPASAGLWLLRLNGTRVVGRLPAGHPGGMASASPGYKFDRDAFWPDVVRAAGRWGSSRRLARAIADGHDVNAVGADGRSALHVISLYIDYPHAARMLLKAKANVNAVTWRGMTPLDYASRFGRNRTAAVLVEAGARVGAAVRPARVVRFPRFEPKAPSVDGEFACCLHSCSGHGKCVEGRCECADGWAGVDCGRAVPGACDRRGGIFVGEDGYAISASMPTLISQGGCKGQPTTTVSNAHHGLYAASDVFAARLLRDPARRAPTADCAAADWHPLWAYRHHGNLGVRLKWKLAAQANFKRKARSTLPRIHDEPQDRGECGAPPELYWPGDVVLTYWGDTRCFPADVEHVVLPPGTSGPSGLHFDLKAKGAAWKAVDRRLVEAARIAYADEEFSKTREHSVFFRGSHRSTPYVRALGCDQPRAPSDACRDVYSMGARQLLQRLYGDGQSPSVAFNRVKGKEADAAAYHAMLRTHDFCLSVAGNSYCPRIGDYVAAACIPVIVRPGDLLWPYEPDLDYGEFSIDVGFEDLPRLPEIIANVSEAEVRRKRERLREIYRMFIWADEEGNAYEAVMAAMMARVRR